MDILIIIYLIIHLQILIQETQVSQLVQGTIAIQMKLKVYLDHIYQKLQNLQLNYQVRIL